MSNNPSFESTHESSDSQVRESSQFSLIQQVVTSWIDTTKEPLRSPRVTNEDIIIPRGRAVQPGNYDPISRAVARSSGTEEAKPMGRAMIPKGRANPGRDGSPNVRTPDDQRTSNKNVDAKPVGRAFNPLGQAIPEIKRQQSHDGSPKPSEQKSERRTTSQAITQDSPGLDTLAKTVRTAVAEAQNIGSTLNEALTKVGESIESALPGYSVIFENTPAGQLLMRLYGAKLPRTGLSIEIKR